MLQILRDKNYIDDKNANSFIRAIKKECKNKDVSFEIIDLNIIKGGSVELHRVDNREPLIVIEPFEEGSTKKFLLNNCWNVDRNTTAEVVAKICENHIPCNVLIVNRSNLIGQPLQKMLLDKNYTTILAHSRTNGLQRLIDVAEIVVFATGNDMRKYNCEGKFVIDVSNDYQRERCGSYFNMSHIGKRTVERIVSNAR